MKITWIENLIKKGEVLNYDYCYTDDNQYMLVTVNLKRVCIFPDDLKLINRKAKRGQNARLQYISIGVVEGKYVQSLHYIVG